jgi:hypothetical protein
MAKSPAARECGTGRGGLALADAWSHDHAKFESMVEAAVASGSDADIRRGMALICPNGRDAAMSHACRLTETVPAPDKGLWGRLLVIPVIVHPADGNAPDAGGIGDAVLASGMVPQGARIHVLLGYWDLAATAALRFSGRRALLRATLSGGPCPVPPAALEAPAARSGRGLPCSVVCAVTVPDPRSDMPLLDGDLELLDFRGLLTAILRTGGGLVDAAMPVPACCLPEVIQPHGRWLVERLGARQEIRDFLSAAADACGRKRVACSVRRTGHRLAVRTHGPSGVIDERELDPFDLPISPGEFLRETDRLSASFWMEAEDDGLADFTRERPPMAPPRRGQRLRAIVGGRIQREIDDAAAWRDGLRKRMEGATAPTGGGV